MGASASNESRLLYKIDQNFIFTKMNFYAVFEESPFAKGACRYCYKGHIKNRNGVDIKNSFFPSGECVVKVFQKKIAEKYSDLNEDFKNSIYAYKMANIFNSKNLGIKFYKLVFVLPFAGSLAKYASFNLFFFIPKRSDDSMAKIKENEWLSIEPFLTGKYEKFVSNTNDPISTIGMAIPTFMHWNWVYSKGERVVSDIQGIEKQLLSSY